MLEVLGNLIVIWGIEWYNNGTDLFATNYPELKGFNRRGLYRMKQFYELYKDDEVVEFALSRSLSPTMVSEYNLKLIDKKLLQKKLKEYIELAGTAEE